MAEILEGLFLGSYHNASDLSFLKRHKISHIMCTAAERKPNFGSKFIYWQINATNQPGFKLLPLLDRTSNLIHSCLSQEPTIDKIGQNSVQSKESAGDPKNSQNRILVHCSDGRSRAASVVLAYLIKYKKMDLKTAFSFVRRKFKISPNLGFIMQLRKFERRIVKNCSQEFAYQNSLGLFDTEEASWLKKKLSEEKYIEEELLREGSGLEEVDGYSGMLDGEEEAMEALEVDRRAEVRRARGSLKRRKRRGARDDAGAGRQDGDHGGPGRLSGLEDEYAVASFRQLSRRRREALSSGNKAKKRRSSRLKSGRDAHGRQSNLREGSKGPKSPFRANLVKTPKLTKNSSFGIIQGTQRTPSDSESGVGASSGSSNIGKVRNFEESEKTRKLKKIQNLSISHLNSSLSRSKRGFKSQIIDQYWRNSLETTQNCTTARDLSFVNNELTNAQISIKMGIDLPPDNILTQTMPIARSNTRRRKKSSRRHLSSKKSQKRLRSRQRGALRTPRAQSLRKARKKASLTSKKGKKRLSSGTPKNGKYVIYRGYQATTDRRPASRDRFDQSRGSGYRKSSSERKNLIRKNSSRTALKRGQKYWRLRQSFKDGKENLGLSPFEVKLKKIKQKEISKMRSKTPKRGSSRPQSTRRGGSRSFGSGCKTLRELKGLENEILALNSRMEFPGQEQLHILNSSVERSIQKYHRGQDHPQGAEIDEKGKNRENRIFVDEPHGKVLSTQNTFPGPSEATLGDIQRLDAAMTGRHKSPSLLKHSKNVMNLGGLKDNIHPPDPRASGRASSSRRSVKKSEENRKRSKSRKSKNSKKEASKRSNYGAGGGAVVVSEVIKKRKEKQRLSQIKKSKILKNRKRRQKSDLGVFGRSQHTKNTSKDSVVSISSTEESENKPVSKMSVSKKSQSFMSKSAKNGNGDPQSSIVCTFRDAEDEQKHISGAISPLTLNTLEYTKFDESNFTSGMTPQGSRKSLRSCNSRRSIGRKRSEKNLPKIPKISQNPKIGKNKQNGGGSKGARTAGGVERASGGAISGGKGAESRGNVKKKVKNFAKKRYPKKLGGRVSGRELSVRLDIVTKSEIASKMKLKKQESPILAKLKSGYDKEVSRHNFDDYMRRMVLGDRHVLANTQKTSKNRPKKFSKHSKKNDQKSQKNAFLGDTMHQAVPEYLQSHPYNKENDYKRLNISNKDPLLAAENYSEMRLSGDQHLLKRLSGGGQSRPNTKIDQNSVIHFEDENSSLMNFSNIQPPSELPSLLGNNLSKIYMHDELNSTGNARELTDSQAGLQFWNLFSNDASGEYNSYEALMRNMGEMGSLDVGDSKWYEQPLDLTVDAGGEDGGDFEVDRSDFIAL